MTEAPDEKDELIARYLLNELSESENEDLEDEMVLDEELAERRQIVEMNLIDSYLMDEMSPDERLRFKSGFLLFPENRLKVEEARMLHDNLRLMRKELPEGQKEPSEGEREQPASLPESAAKSQRRWFAFLPAPAFAALALLLVLGLGYFLIPWREIFKGQTDNRNVVLNPSPQATPGLIIKPEGTPNSNAPENLNGNQNSPPGPGQNTPEQPEVAMLPRQPETVNRTITERPGLVGGTTTKGGESARVKPQTVQFPRGSKFLKLTVWLRPDREVGNDTRLPIAVYNLKNLDSPIFPGRGSLQLKPGRVGRGKPRYFITVEIPAGTLRDGQTYYLRIDEEAEPTSFKVKMTDAEP